MHHSETTKSQKGKKNLKRSQRKEDTIFKGSTANLTANISRETVDARKQHSVINVLKGITSNLP